MGFSAEVEAAKRDDWFQKMKVCTGVLYIKLFFYAFFS